MKIIKLLLLSLIVLSCSKEDEVEPDYYIPTEYGVYVKGLISEYDYKFYNYNTGEIYHEGTTSESFILFNVTSKEKSNTHIVSEIHLRHKNTKVFALIKNGDFFLNYKNNPEAINIYELNNAFTLDENIYELLIPLEAANKDKWVTE